MLNIVYTFCYFKLLTSLDNVLVKQNVEFYISLFLVIYTVINNNICTNILTRVKFIVLPCYQIHLLVTAGSQKAGVCFLL